jgi:DNA-binding CsgD family transcriptional regulator
LTDTDSAISHVRITPRQLECIELAGEGLTSKEIARKLGISHRTVEAHISAVMEALEVGTRAAAVLKVKDFQHDEALAGSDKRIALRASATEEYLITPARSLEPPMRVGAPKRLFPPIGGRANASGKKQLLIWIARITTATLVLVNVIILSIMAVSAMAEPAP